MQTIGNYYRGPSRASVQPRAPMGGPGYGAPMGRRARSGINSAGTYSQGPHQIGIQRPMHPLQQRVMQRPQMQPGMQMQRPLWGRIQAPNPWGVGVIGGRRLGGGMAGMQQRQPHPFFGSPW